MSYTLKLTNGTILVTLPDQTADRIHTSLTLIGKNVNAYGTDLNDNFIHVLENFANNIAPVQPLVGQLWYNTTDRVMQVYRGSPGWKTVGAPIISATEPPTSVISDGDLWIDSANKKLKFKVGSQIFDSGIPYNYTEGLSGVLIEDTTATTIGNARYLGTYINGGLIGIFSTSTFSFNSPVGAIQNVYPGFNANPGTKFHGIATSADGLLSNTGTVITAEQFLRKDQNPNFSATVVTIYSDDGLKIGKSLNSGEIQIWQTGTSITTSTVIGELIKVATLSVNGEYQDFNLEINPPTTSTFSSVLYADATNNRLGIFNTRPTTDVDIKGNVNINGNLSVLGTSTYITSADLRVDDKNIELAYTTGTATDSFADGGGIILHGDTDKSIIWTISENAWTSNENLNITAGNAYKINGADVLTSGTLAQSVTSAPGLNSIGTLTNLQVNNVYIYGSTVTTKVSGPLYIGDNTVTSAVTLVDFTGKRLYNVATPSQLPSTDTWVISQVANKKYVDDLVAANRYIGNYSTTIDVTGFAVAVNDPALDPYVISVLQLMFPPNELPPYNIVDGSRARIMVIRNQTTALFNVASNYLNPGNPLKVDANGVINSAEAIEYSTFLRVTTNIPATLVETNRAIKQYQVVNGVWAPSNLPGHPDNTVYTDGSW